MQNVLRRRPAISAILFWCALSFGVVVSIALSPWAISTMNQLAATAGLPAIFGLLAYALLIAILASLLDGPRLQRIARALLIPTVSYLLYETWAGAMLVSAMVVHLSAGPLAVVLAEWAAQAVIQGVMIAVVFCGPMALIYRRRAVTATCIALMPFFAQVLENVPNASVEKLLAVRFLVVLVPYAGILVAMIAALAIVDALVRTFQRAHAQPSVTK